MHQKFSPRVVLTSAVAFAFLSSLNGGARAESQLEPSAAACGAEPLVPDSAGRVMTADGVDLTMTDHAVDQARSRGYQWVKDIKCVVVPRESVSTQQLAPELEPGVPATIGSTTNSIWAGYVAYMSQTPVSVTANWTVKPVTGSSGDRATTWVGLGNSPLQQAGTISEINGTTKTYKAFWEIVPLNAVQVFSGFNPLANDSVTTSVIYTGGRVYFTFTDHTQKKVLTVSGGVAYGPPSKQAECIVERLQVGSGPAPLANFSSQAISNCVYRILNATSDTAIPVNGTKIDCVAGGVTYMTTGTPSGSTGFQVTWKHR